MQIAYIKQKLAHDCGIAALAMATGRQYEEILEPFRHRIIEESRGLHEMYFNEWFYRHGWATQQVYRVHQYGGANLKHGDWPPKPWAPVHIVEARVSGGNYHFVVMDDRGVIFDPWDESKKTLADPFYIEIPWVMGLWPVTDGQSGEAK